MSFRRSADDDAGTTYPSTWALPLIVAALVVPVVAGFAVAGPVLGLAMGAAVGAVLLFVSARMRPSVPIETAVADDAHRRVLVVVSREVDRPAQAEEVAARVRSGEAGQPEVLVLAPAKSGALDRWATDVGRSRDEARRKATVSVVQLAKADIDARAAIGDESIIRAVEDRLREFAADEVVLVTGAPDEDPEGESAYAELRDRLRQPFTRIVGNGSA